MGASFQISGKTQEQGRVVYEPLAIVPTTVVTSLPTDGGTWAYSHVAAVLACFGVVFDAEYYCGSIDPMVLIRAPYPETVACVHHTPAVLERVKLLKALAWTAHEIGAVITYS